MEMKTNTIDKNLIDLIQEIELKEQILALSKAYKKVIDKSFSIGVMGKAGAGKSSFINSLCQGYVCETGGVGGCTREIQKIDAKLGEMDIRLYDFPGIAENSQWNQAYWNLYIPYLREMDMIFWLIKVDDRAVVEDEKFYKKCIENDRELSDKFIIILSQADKAEPNREWDHEAFKPSFAQEKTLLKNKQRIYADFIDSTTPLTSTPSSIKMKRVITIAIDFIKNRGKLKIYGFNGIFDILVLTLFNISGIKDKLPSTIYKEIAQKRNELTKNESLSSVFRSVRSLSSLFGRY